MVVQYNFGNFYSRGEGLYDVEVVKWFCKVVEQGFSLVQVSFVEMYERGEGVPKDEKEVVRWCCLLKEPEGVRKTCCFVEKGFRNVQYNFG